ncbi:MAG: threonine--tRNA ligase, partial [Bacteroidales bacterium]|nr:threonine--tRNA ligase [Bacteroidales bacterium]
IDADGSKKRPIMIHRAPFGSIERFTAVLLEHTAGHLPVWLAPEQVKVLPISEKFENYAKKVCDLLNNSEIRASIDARNETLGKRIRDIAQFRVPLLVVVGEKEEADGTVSVRREGVNVGTMSAEDFVKYVKSAVAEELS